MRISVQAGYAMAASLMVAGLLAGCAATPAPQPPPAPVVEPVSSDDFPQIKSSYEQANPNAIVGRVTAVKPDASLAAVGDIAVDRLSVGEPITFLDAHGDTLAIGSVHLIAADQVVVKYDPPTGSRGPEIGDLAVRVK
jgi:hypothetical protein